MPFKGRAEVVPYLRYKHPVSGRTFSRFTSWYEPGSVLEQEGFTINWPEDGTQGICKPPFKTEAEAQAWADRWNGGER